MPDALSEVTHSRPITVEDVPWILSLAHRRYTKTPDPGTTLKWLMQVINSPNEALAIRSDHAFCVAIYSVPPWWPNEPEVHIAVLVADKGAHWQAIRLLKDTIAWARGRGCARWWLSSETDYDFEMLAKRVGARPRVMKYEVPLTGIPGG